VVPVGGRGRHAHNSAAAFVRLADANSFSTVQSATVEDIHSVCNKSHILTHFPLAIANNSKHNN